MADHRGAGQGTSRADRRGLHGLQERADRGRRRPRQGHRAAARARPGGGRQEVGPRGARGPRLELHPHRWPRRRAHRGELRDRLRRAHGRVPEARPRPRGPGRRPRARCTSTRSASRPTPSTPRRPSCSRTNRVQKKPENIRPQIVEGQLKKWFAQVCLVDQPFRDEERTVGDLITEKIATIGENIRVRRFVRYALGEEL